MNTKLRATIAAHQSWANTENRAARTLPARRAAMARFERQVDPEGVMTPEARALAAESARKAFYLRMAQKSVAARAAKKAAGTTPPGRFGPDHHRWLARDISYQGAHRRVARVRGRASNHDCIDCGKGALDWSYNYTDPDEIRCLDSLGRNVTYSADPAFYDPRCRKCHRHFDTGRNAVQPQFADR